MISEVAKTDIEMVTSYPFLVEHLHKTTDVVSEKPVVDHFPGFRIKCQVKTEYGPALLSDEELENLPKAKKKFYTISFIAQSYYCDFCNRRVAYTRTSEEGRMILYLVDEGVVVTPFTETDDEVKLNQQLTEVYGLFANVMNLEDPEEERLLLHVIRAVYVHKLEDANSKLQILLAKRRGNVGLHGIPR